jgi:hypothetical protein
MATLPVDERGYPVPFFVAWIDDKPDFRVMDPEKWQRAVKDRLCWVCGKRLGSYMVFVLGPMCGITRTSAEPPCHLECARWSAINCPFLARPHMVRREHEQLLAQGAVISGESIERNPGVSALWICHDYKLFRPNGGGMLIEVGDPEEVQWFAEGRIARREEVIESIRTGLPALEAEAEKEKAKGAVEDLRRRVRAFQRWVPAPAPKITLSAEVSG